MDSLIWYQTSSNERSFNNTKKFLHPMTGKDNQSDPTELFKKWFEDAAKTQSDWTSNMKNMFQQNNPNPFNLQNMLPNFLSWGAFKTTVGSNGRISIPEAEREALGVDEGDLVQIVVLPIKQKG